MNRAVPRAEKLSPFTVISGLPGCQVTTGGGSLSVRIRRYGAPRQAAASARRRMLWSPFPPTISSMWAPVYDLAAVTQRFLAFFAERRAGHETRRPGRNRRQGAGRRLPGRLGPAGFFADAAGRAAR